jgi:hypothetical protein
MPSDSKIAVLIDADNVSFQYIKYILDEISNQGTPTYKRIYGDWTKPQLAPWKNVLLKHSITPIQQYSYTTGKNATDAALIIDAMDIYTPAASTAFASCPATAILPSSRPGCGKRAWLSSGWEKRKRRPLLFPPVKNSNIWRFWRPLRRGKG